MTTLVITYWNSPSRWRISSLAVLLLIAFDPQTAFSQSPKTIFAWSDVEAEVDEDDEAPDRLVTDRPHFSEASSLVGLGRVQLETGYSYFRDNDGGTFQTHSFPEPLLRAGLFAE